jgi:para-aminobenzoate synthetase/4-amino-4-deoxychorismate lyase
METGFLGDAASFYLDLVRAQSCGYGAFLDTGRFAIASASPELFFEWRHGTILCRPMKGTIRRGLTLTEDEEQRSRLERSDKDRAENLMIVDMVRNDLGRVARTGTIATPVLFSSEKYDTVWQLTSTVVAEPRKDCRIGDIFAALFPSASITGAPKVATMGIIADLEADPRGVYCGAIGFGGPDAGGDRQWAFNVAIRTVTIDRANSTARYGTGGGVTYDSTPAGEYAEALLKAAVLARTSADFQLLETIRFDPALDDEGGLWLLDRHLERLIASARYFEIPLDPAEVRAALRSAVAGASEVRRLRLLVDRTGLVTVEDSDPGAASPTEGARVGIDAVPVDEGDPFLYHKTTHRRAYVEALARNPNVDDVILINAAGHVTETSVANLAACLDGVWVTPPVSDGLLPGTFRAELLARGELFERSLTPADLKEATELARFNSVRGWEAVLLDG